MKLPKSTVLLIAIAIMLAALSALCGAVVHVSADPELYGNESRLAVAKYLGREVGQEGLSELDETAVTKYVGLSREEQEDVAWKFALNVRLPGATFADFDILNEREQQHMRDVRDLIVLADRVSQASAFVAALLVVAAAWTGAGLAHRARTGLLGALCGMGALALIAGAFLLAMNTAGFERLFVLMHQTLFANDLWLLNPSTDILIRMMPQPLFEMALGSVLRGALARFGVVLALLTAAHLIIGGIVRRNLTEREQA